MGLDSVVSETSQNDKREEPKARLRTSPQRLVQRDNLFGSKREDLVSRQVFGSVPALEFSEA